MKQLRWSKPVEDMVRAAADKLAVNESIRNAEYRQGVARVASLVPARKPGKITDCINETIQRRNDKRRRIEAAKLGEGSIATSWIVEPSSQSDKGMRASGVYRKRVGKCRSLLVKHNKRSVARNMGDVDSDKALLLALLAKLG